MSNKRQLDDKDIRCDRCGSTNWVGHGKKGTIKHGERQRYYCKDCYHTFYSEKDKQDGGN